MTDFKRFEILYKLYLVSYLFRQAQKEVGMSTEAEKDYERYLERFCTKHHLTREEAEDHNLVKTVKRYYEKKGCVKNE